MQNLYGKEDSVKVRSTFRILTLFTTLLIFSSHPVFGREPHPTREPRPTKPKVDQKTDAVLLIGDHEGVDEKDVQNAALLVAKELRQHNIFVGDPVNEVPTSGTIYRVVLRRSDEKILFRLSQEDTTGVVLVEREMLLADIEKIDSTAPRLIYALVHRESITSPSVLMNLGVFTTVAPIEEVSPFGAEIGFSFYGLSYAVDVEFQVAWRETEFRSLGRRDQSKRKDYFHFYSTSVGGRYFFMEQNVSPYVGGGLGMMFTKYETTIKTPNSPDNALEAIAVIFTAGQSLWDYDVHTEETAGIGTYGVLGIEFLRFSRGRLKIELRVDRPFFKLPSRDVMPITVGIAGGVSF